MKIKEESSFLQGLESRLDTLFAEDPKTNKEKDSDPSQSTLQEAAPDVMESFREIPDIKETSRVAEVSSNPPQKTAQEVAPDVMESFREIPDIKETSRVAEVSSDSSQPQDKSTFISEIEKRFSAIFGEDDKNVSAVKATAMSDDLNEVIAQDEQAEPDDLKRIIAQAEQEEIKKPNEFLGDISSTPSSVLLSPLKEMKSIILSIEWEINDDILGQLDDEINKLYLLYTGDFIIQGLLRILRFMGRYVRVRGVRSNQESINLLLSVYDHLENVMISGGMTEAKKHIILIDNIKKYRTWVESTDLETGEGSQVPETTSDEFKSSAVETLDGKFLKDQKVAISPLVDIQVAEKELIAEAVIEKVIEEEPRLREPEPEEKIEFAVKESDIFVQEEPTSIAKIPPLAGGDKTEAAITAIKNLPPHEAFVYALEEIKKTFQSELDALKEEIRILKSVR